MDSTRRGHIAKVHGLGIMPPCLPQMSKDENEGLVYVQCCNRMEKWNCTTMCQHTVFIGGGLSNPKHKDCCKICKPPYTQYVGYGKCDSANHECEHCNGS